MRANAITIAIKAETATVGVKMEIKIKKLTAFAMTPTYGTPGSACFDLYASHPAYIESGTHKKVGTGLAFEIPEGHVMLVFPRSGLAAKHYINLSNCTGVIDSDYRGEVSVLLKNNWVDSYDYSRPFEIAYSDRIAQAMVIPVEQVEFVEVSELSQTSRGDGGFGSTGE